MMTLVRLEVYTSISIARRANAHEQVQDVLNSSNRMSLPMMADIAGAAAPRDRCLVLGPLAGL